MGFPKLVSNLVMAGCHLPASPCSSPTQAEREGFPQKGLPSPSDEHTNPAVPYMLALPHEKLIEASFYHLYPAPQQSWYMTTRPFV